MEELQFLCHKIRLRFEDKEIINSGGEVRIIDPCCGEGVALEMLSDTLREQGSNVKSYGVELEEFRYVEAKKVLDHVIHDGYENLRTQPIFVIMAKSTIPTRF